MMQILVVMGLLFLGSSIGYYTGPDDWFALVWYLLLLLVIMLFLKSNGSDLKSTFAIRPGYLLRSLLYVPLMYGALFLLNLFFPQTEYVFEPATINLPTVLTLTIIGPLVEEVTFRVYFQDIFKRRFGINATIILSSLFFAFLHPLSVFPHVFVIAVFLSSLREVYGSITPSVLVHCLNNTVALMFNVLT